MTTRGQQRMTVTVKGRKYWKSAKEVARGTAARSGRKIGKSPALAAPYGEAAKILEGHYHMKRHSDGKTPWQFALADYEVRFSDNTPRGTGRQDGGSWGIYLRAYDVRVATFADNSACVRDALARMFDAVHVFHKDYDEKMSSKARGRLRAAKKSKQKR